MSDTLPELDSDFLLRGHNDFKLPSIQPYLGTYTQMTLSSGARAPRLDVELSRKGQRIAARNVDVANFTPSTTRCARNSSTGNG